MQPPIIVLSRTPRRPLTGRLRVMRGKTNPHRLTAVATYTDGHANEEDAKDMVIARGDNDVLTSTVNQAPVFPDMDDEMEGRQTAQERSIRRIVPQ